VADFLTKQARSLRMSLIRGKDTQPELIFRKALHSRGFRYRTHASQLPGKPDIVLPKYNSVIFVHDCFWHSHQGCRIANSPKTNSDFWQNKFLTNKRRDKRNQRRLRILCWNIIIVWECELGSKTKLRRTIEKTVRRLRRHLGT
jgi:DNA mismatch endonuclease, patch repair protein